MRMKYMNYYNSGAMKIKYVTIYVILVLFSSAAFAQNPNREKLTAYKIAFFTRKLNLTPHEAEKFWPLYNDYQDRKAQIQQERVQLNRRVNQEGSTLSEKELAAAGDKLIELQVAETELAVAFHKQLKVALPPAKVIKVYQAENQYRMQLLNQLQQRNPQRDDLRQREYQLP